MGHCSSGIRRRLTNRSVVAIGEEDDQMGITADGEDAIDGKRPSAERVSRINDRDLTGYAINDSGILLSLVP